MVLNVSLPFQSVNSTELLTKYNCLLLEDTESFVIYTSYLLSIILLLPLFILVLIMVLRRWKSAIITTSVHMDILTYHMVLMEIVGVGGACFFYYKSAREEQNETEITTRFASFIGTGQSLFHLLACLDRYLAVAHPIRYMWMRQSAGNRLRNAVIGCSWLLCLIPCVINVDIIPFFSVFFSSGTLCVLFVISHSEPSRKARAKQRALSTVAAISTSLFLRLLSSMVPPIFYETLNLSLSQQCLVIMVSLPFSLPSSLVMPLLFLQRVGKLSNCQHTSNNKD